MLREGSELGENNVLAARTLLSMMATIPAGSPWREWGGGSRIEGEMLGVGGVPAEHAGR